MNVLLGNSALMALALVPITLGCIGSVEILSVKTAERDERESLSFDDAKLLPLFGSMTLLSLYVLVSYYPDWVNLLLGAYFTLFGIGSTTGLLCHYIPSERDYCLKLTRGENLFTIHFSHLDLFFGCLSLGLAVGYSLSKHWILTNIYGEAFAITAIQLLQLESFATGILVLAGLFFYDIFWVFGTNVMVTVATKIDAPIKVLWPKGSYDLLLNGSLVWANEFSNFRLGDILSHDLYLNGSLVWAKIGLGDIESLDVSLNGSLLWPKEFSMLGLGDIVIPGIYLSLCLRFDYYQFLSSKAKGGSTVSKSLSSKDESEKIINAGWSFPKPYFIGAFIGYIVGLSTTMLVLLTFKAAQPALLYLSPSCIFSTLIVALLRGEWRSLWDYHSDKHQTLFKSLYLSGKSNEKMDDATNTIEGDQDDQVDQDNLKVQEKTTRRLTRSSKKSPVKPTK